ncbi:endophilin-A isoform X10 [Bombus vosnesenskii]|uniref:Endophilin-A isoform X10 n=2 Tax=Pyrobombus TaxID=144703 RepID=A0A6J3K8R2_9HYME|nr:endophilin-A isoform X10 [Bombus vancouverensis nearcticus]XP_033303813.1 endophilin-A isoform X10 [Bombus bifarius]XP_033348891.1 endophilin-A isoform X10 [Bombus vosnesenskii]
MAFAGLKKQINKANQYMTEKMGGAEGTKLDVDFMDMERKTDVTYELVEELQMKTKEFLQPNPTARAKMAAVKGISKLSGQAKASTYPQPEGVLGDCMLIYGKKLGEDSIFAQALVEMGEAMKQMADVKYSLDDNIKQNFLEPLHHLQTKDLKEVMHHRKKLQGRRLDFDCKRRRQAKATGKRSASPHFGSPVKSSSPYTGSHVSDDEIRQAEEKFAESLHLAQLGMFNLLENDVEQVAQLATFSEGLLEYHQQCTEILRTLTETLLEKKDEAANKPKMEFIPKTLADLHVDALPTSDAMNGGNFSFHGASRAGSPIHGDGKRSQLELFPAGNPPQSANGKFCMGARNFALAITEQIASQDSDDKTTLLYSFVRFRGRKSWRTRL